MSARRGLNWIAQEMKDAEDRVGVGAGVGHDLGRLQLGLPLQHDQEQGQAVAQGHEAQRISRGYVTAIQARASGMRFWAATKMTFDRVSVSARM